ncbi:MAG: VanW family protein [bacterium]
MFTARKIPTKNNNFVRWIAVIIIAAAILAAAGFAIPFAYTNRVYPGLRLGGQTVGDLPLAEAKKKISQWAEQLEKKGIKVTVKNVTVTIPSTLSSPTNPDLSVPLYSIDKDKTYQTVSQWGRAVNPYRALWEIIQGKLLTPELPFQTMINQEQTQKYLDEVFKAYVKAPENPRLVFQDNQYDFTAGSPGTAIQWEEVSKQMETMLAKGELNPIRLTITDVQPSISRITALPLLKDIPALLDKLPVAIMADGEQLTSITKETLPDWLEAQGNNRLPRWGLSDLGKNKISKLASSFDRQAQDAKFELDKETNRMSVFQPSHDGRMIDQDKTREIISQLLEGKKEITLPITIAQAKIKTGDVNDFGIKEIIGIGKSNFSGSPSNRRHNIKTGAYKLNGILIAPNEEFSLLKALGKVDAEAGYLPELVIKGNRTIPEFGGGLCQIGTTTFRTALESGLPITVRQNHSYQVQYYAPAGTDATIYDPAPDFRFKNDTGNYILIQTRMEKDDLFFEFWGTKDGRVSLWPTPKVLSSTPPPAKKVVYTADLAPGKEKCTEKAHNGAEALLIYTVTMPDGQIRKQEFRSKYKPWQAVCFVGVSKEELEAKKTETGTLLGNLKVENNTTQYTITPVEGTAVQPNGQTPEVNGTGN